ncbi:hypothetical protein [Algoriphagus sp. NG3]|nr:hypothetical protein [Algoriphagus sp. NG3]WPR76355.1 hypothetical protein SLW71_03215 [Algoriphagus sp. NG3]
MEYSQKKLFASISIKLDKYLGLAEKVTAMPALPTGKAGSKRPRIDVC